MLAGRKIICVEQNVNVEEHRGTNLEISSVTVGVAECSGKCNRYREGEPVDRHREGEPVDRYREGEPVGRWTGTGTCTVRGVKTPLSVL